jgi:hypothetical protein
MTMMVLSPYTTNADSRQTELIQCPPQSLFGLAPVRTTIEIQQPDFHTHQCPLLNSGRVTESDRVPRPRFIA